MKKGFSLAEMIITLILTGIIVLMGIPAFNKVDFVRYNKIYKSVFELTNMALKELPFPFDNTFCNSFVNKINTIGSINCNSSSLATNQPNFITTNGVKWYGFEGDFSTDPKKITVDVSKTNTLNQDNADILKIRVFKAGYALPDLDPVEIKYAYGDGTSCHTIKNAINTLISRNYTLTGNGTPFDVYCEMMMNSNTWTLPFQSWNKGLVAYYPFDSDINDASGNGNNGTDFGTTSVGAKFGNGRYFNQSSYISVTNPKGLDFTDAFTVSLWVRRDSVGNTVLRPIISKGWNNYTVMWGWSCDVYIWAGSHSERDFFNCYNPNPMDHMVVVYNNPNGYLYVNGVKYTMDATASPETLLTGTNAFMIGAFPDALDWAGMFDGVMDDLVIWNRALTDKEIQQLYTLGTHNYSFKSKN